MDINMLRKDVTADATTEFAFQTACCDFLVKNMTDGDVYVAFGEVPESKDNMLLIPEGSWQRHLCRTADGGRAACRSVFVIGTGNTGKGVEVECLKW